MTTNTKVSDDTIDLSICIPTFNRSRYLNHLLNDFAEKQESFSFRYELIISDNASQDETPAVVNTWKSALPITYVRQTENLGPTASLRDAYSYARGTISMYLADDDMIRMEGLSESLNKLLESPESIALYAPWCVGNLDSKDDPFAKQAFDLSRDYLFKRGEHAEFLNLILDKRIFPEIFMFRTAALKLMTFNPNPITYWAFTQASDLLTHGDIIFSKTPYYSYVIDYFEDEGRITEGGREIQTSWDLYRGGFEYFAAKLIDRMDARNQSLLKTSIDDWVAERMASAIQTRLQANANPIETYYIASRVIGSGHQNLLPLRFNELRTQAALWYLGNDIYLTEGIERIILVGEIHDLVFQLVERYTHLPVIRIPELDGSVKNSICLLSKNNLPEKDVEDLERTGNVIVTQAQLMRLFP